jgi:hypothetical protein
LLLLSAALSPEACQGLETMLSRVWAGCAERVMGRGYRPSRKYGVDLEQCHRADYLAKLGLEIADAGQAKRSRNVKGRSYWQLARDWIAAGKDRSNADAARILEYFEGMHGAKIVTWSRGMKRRAEELSPEVLAAERESAQVHSEAWDRLRDRQTETGVDARAALLTTAEQADPGHVQGAVDAFIDDLLRSKRGPPGHS